MRGLPERQVSVDIRATFQYRYVPLRSGQAMTTIPDIQLHAHSERLRGKVVLITGEKDVLRHSLFALSLPPLDW